MALVSQMLAASYPAVLNKKRSPENQWATNAFLRKLEQMGAIDREDFGSSLDITLDYQKNDSFQVLTSDLQVLPIGKTSVLTSATYDIAEIAGHMVWSRKDEVMNPSENQKAKLVASIIDNGLQSHDDVLGRALAATSTNGLLGFGTHAPTAGTGSDGGIDSSLYTWWRLQTQTYVDDTDIVSALNVNYNNQSKGSGESLVPTWAVSDGATQALFEGTQLPQQRWVDSDDLKVGFKTIAFKTAKWVFDQFFSTSIYMGNAKNFRVKVSKGNFRDKGDVESLITNGQRGYICDIYSALQTVVNNRSRLSVTHL